MEQYKIKVTNIESFKCRSYPTKPILLPKIHNKIAIFPIHIYISPMVVVEKRMVM